VFALKQLEEKRAKGREEGERIRREMAEQRRKEKEERLIN